MLRVWKGLGPAVLAEAGVSERGRLVRVPYRCADGREHGAKLFAGGGRSWWETAGRELLPFGIETLPGPAFACYCALVVCEGESDALAVRDAFGNREDERAVAWFALALPGARTWRDEWRCFLEPFPLIYLAGDGDEPGRAMNRAVRRAVPWARPLWLPDGEDARSLLQRNPLALEPLLDAADADARFWAALVLSPDLPTFHALFSGKETR